MVGSVGSHDLEVTPKSHHLKLQGVQHVRDRSTVVSKGLLERQWIDNVEEEMH